MISEFSILVNDQVQGPFTADQLRDLYRRREIDNLTLVRVGSEWKRLCDSKDDIFGDSNPVTDPVIQPIASGSPVNPNEAVLSGARERSCYKTLRSVINVGFSIIYVAIALLELIVIGSVSFVLRQSNGQFIVVCASLGLSVIAFCVAAAAHQAALLMVDIADVSIDSLRKYNVGHQ